MYWHNPAGRVISHISRIYSEDFSRILLESTLEKEYLYDTLETRSEFVRTVFEEDLSVFRSETNQTYTPDGLLLTFTTRVQESVDGPWTGGGSHYEYDENGCQSLVLNTRLSGDEMIAYGGTRFEHDALCRETRETSFRLVDGIEVEGRATFTTYNDGPELFQKVQFIRENPSSAWQFDQELERRQSGDSTIETLINNELTFHVRRVNVRINDLPVLETAEVAYDNQDDFKLSNKFVFSYENSVLMHTSWEERSGDEENRITGKGTITYAYNSDGNITSYESSSVRDGIPSSYRQTYTYRCDGLLEAVEDNNSKTVTSYYGDANCDGPDFSTAMRLYPNPASDQLWLYSHQDMQEALVEVMDLTGRKIDEMSVEGPSYAYLDISGLTPGIYLVRVRGNGIDSTIRFIKQE